MCSLPSRNYLTNVQFVLMRLCIALRLHFDDFMPKCKSKNTTNCVDLGRPLMSSGTLIFLQLFRAFTGGLDTHLSML